MYTNQRPSLEYRDEDNPHEPTNVPETMFEDVHRVFEHVESWSVHAGHVRYVYPKTEEGYDDYAYMLDEMGFEPGAKIEHEDPRGTTTTMVVLSRDDATVHWGEPHHVERAAVTVQLWGGDEEYEGEKRWFTPGEGHSPKNLWKSYIYDQLEVVGHVTD